MTTKKGIGSYPADDPENGPTGGETGGKNDVNLDERMGSNKPRKEGEGELANPDRVKRDSTATGTRWRRTRPARARLKTIRKGIACEGRTTPGANRAFRVPICESKIPC